MAQLPGFNPTDYTPADPDRVVGGAPLPGGWWVMNMIESSLDDNSADAKDPNGTTFNVTWEVDEASHPTHAGRRAWSRLPFTNTKEKAVQIGRCQLSRICRSVGFEGELTDSAVLHHIPCAVHLSIEPPKLKSGRTGANADDFYPPQNLTQGFDDPASRFPDGVTTPEAVAETPAEALRQVVPVAEPRRPFSAKTPPEHPAQPEQQPPAWAQQKP